MSTKGHAQNETVVIGTITRAKYYATPGSSQKFAWYWGYDLRLTGGVCKSCRGECRSHGFGRHALASIRHSAKEWGATVIVEAWKSEATGTQSTATEISVER